MFNPTSRDTAYFAGIQQLGMEEIKRQVSLENSGWFHVFQLIQIANGFPDQEVHNFHDGRSQYIHDV